MRNFPFFALAGSVVISFLAGVALFIGLIVAEVASNKRDVSEDGFRAADSVTALMLGFVRDEVCHRESWSDGNSEAGLDAGYHPHWECDSSKIVLTPFRESAATSYEDLARWMTGWVEFFISIVLMAPLVSFFAYRKHEMG